MSRPETLPDQLKTLSLRLVLELSGLIGFVVLSALCARLIVATPAGSNAHPIFPAHGHPHPTPDQRPSCGSFSGPARPDLRLVAADDWTARFVFHGLVGLAVIIGVGFFFLGLFERSAMAVNETFRFWVSLIVVAWIIYVTWRARQGLTAIIKGDEDNLTSGLERMAVWWPTVSIVGCLCDLVVDPNCD